MLRISAAAIIGAPISELPYGGDEEREKSPGFDIEYSYHETASSEVARLLSGLCFLG